MLVLLALALVAARQPAPNDPYYPQQWGLARVQAPSAWSLTRGEGAIVAIVDSGVDLEHPDLAGAFARRADGSILGYDFVDDDEDPTDEHGHGTMVAGIVAARTSNGKGVAAVAPQSKLMPLRVLDGEARGSAADVDAAIRWAVDHGAHVVNLSLEVAREREEDPLPELDADSHEDAVAYAWNRGVPVVAAAGNDSADFTDYSADSPVLLVGASTRDDERAGFSDAGRRDAVIAPGVEIVSTWCNPCVGSVQHTIGQSEGTSYAAPLVAGSLALLHALGHDHEESVRRVRETAVDVGAPGQDTATGYGRLDTAAAVGGDERSPDRTQSPSPDGTSPSPSKTPGREAADETRPSPPPSPDRTMAPEPTPTSGQSPAEKTAMPTESPDSGDGDARAAPPRSASARQIVVWGAGATALLTITLFAVISVARTSPRRPPWP